MSTKINEALNEKMSAAVDNEASELEIRQLLKAIEKGDDALMEQWQLQHELQDGLEGIETNIDVSAGVMAKVSMTEQVCDVPDQFSDSASAAESDSIAHAKKGIRWSWFANAASVAAVAVFVVMFGNQSFDSSDTQLQVAEKHQSEQFVAQQLAAQQRLQSYINDHAQQASYTGGRAVVLTMTDALEKEKVDSVNE